MENLYIEQYSNKSELEKLKIFLLKTNQYTELLLMGAKPKEILPIVEDPFLKHIIGTDVLEKIDRNQFNYQEEVEKYGLDIELDALAYACAKLKVDVSECGIIKKNIKKMQSVKQ